MQGGKSYHRRHMDTALLTAQRSSKFMNCQLGKYCKYWQKCNTPSAMFYIGGQKIIEANMSKCGAWVWRRKEGRQ